MKTEQRVIKFRAWDVKRKEMFMPSLLSTYSDDNSLPLKTIRFQGDSPKNAILMQFTGLVDKEGNEIYEGDIVECYDHPTNVDSTTGPVEFKHGYYNVNGHALHDYGTAWTKVIGNIYQHPHLLPSTTTI